MRAHLAITTSYGCLFAYWLSDHLAKAPFEKDWLAVQRAQHVAA